MNAAEQKQEQVILVDEHDRVVGFEEKLQAHVLGRLHRAFSVFLFRRTEQGLECLLQQRQQDKYHCGGLWSNACCSHPRPEETVLEAATRRLQEELHLTTALRVVGSFIYRAEFQNGLIEHELDHVVVGEYAEEVLNFNPQEVEACRWVPYDALLLEFAAQPERFTPWFMQGFLEACGTLGQINVHNAIPSPNLGEGARQGG